MFDVSFTELLLIGVVALVVIGPERLPRVARTVGHLVGRAQRYVTDVKTDIKREMDLEKLDDLKSQMEEAAQSVKTSIKDAGDTLRNPLEEAQQALKDASDSVDSLMKASQDEAADNPAETAKETAAAETAAEATPAATTDPQPAPATITQAAPAASTPPADETSGAPPTARNAGAQRQSDAEIADARLERARRLADPAQSGNTPS